MSLFSADNLVQLFADSLLGAADSLTDTLQQCRGLVSDCAVFIDRQPDFFRQFRQMDQFVRPVIDMMQRQLVICQLLKKTSHFSNCLKHSADLSQLRPVQHGSDFYPFHVRTDICQLGNRDTAFQAQNRIAVFRFQQPLFDIFFVRERLQLPDFFFSQRRRRMR